MVLPVKGSTWLIVQMRVIQWFWQMGLLALCDSVFSPLGVSTVKQMLYVTKLVSYDLKAVTLKVSLN